MSWGNPNALYLLFLIPILLIFLLFFKKKRIKQLLKFCDEYLISFHDKSFSGFYYSLKSFIMIIVFALLIIALARPQWDREIRVVDKHGQDIVFLIDVSKSMDAQDINPTRLERAKTQINLFLDELKGDRVSIVAFAGNASVVCPLTTDYTAVKLIVSNLSTETITSYGTNIAAGLKKASEVFNQETNAKTVILLSDGEDLEEQGVSLSRQLASQGITVYTIGIGSVEGTPILIKNSYGQNEYAKDDKGNVIITKLDINGLHRIADITNGKFYLVSPDYSEIFEILKQIQDNERTKYSTKQFFRYKEQYHYFLILAILFLIIETFISYRIKEK